MELQNIKMPALPKRQTVAPYIKTALLTVLSFVFARSPVTAAAYPFAYALLCSTRSPLGTLGVWLGAAASSAFGGGGVIGVLMYAAVLAVRSALSAARLPALDKPDATAASDAASNAGKKSTLATLSFLYDEHTALRACVAAGGSFVAAALSAVVNGFLYYDIFAAVFSAAVSAILVLLFDGFSHPADGAVKKKSHAGRARGKFSPSRYIDPGLLPDRYALAMAAAAFVTLFCLRNTVLYIFNIATAAAFILCMLGARYGGAIFGRAGGSGSYILYGAATGLCFGMACSPSIPLIGAAGLAAGAVFTAADTYALTGVNSPKASVKAGGGAVIPTAAVLCGGALCVCLDIASSGFAVLQTNLPAIALGSAVSVILIRFDLPRLALPRLAPPKAVAEALPDADRAVAESVGTLADAYESLSRTFNDLAAHQRRPDIYEVAGLISSAASKRCRSCPQNPVCHGKERSATEDVFAKITASLFERAEATAAVVPDYMAQRCFHMPAILDECADEYARLVYERSVNDKTDVFALDYSCTAKLLRDVTARAAAENSPDGDSAAKLARSLSYIGLSAGAVAVWGRRIKHVAMYGMSLSGARVGADDLRLAVGNIIGAPTCDPCFSIDGESVNVTLSGAPRISLTCARRMKPADTSPDEKKSKSEPCGDTVSYFTTSDRRAYALVCDGMGSGAAAALTSRVCAMYLEKMLCAGASVTVALELLGGFLRSRSIECSAAVDLCEVDLAASSATFIKSGAAPTFIVRDGAIFRLQSKTVPIGILRALDTELTTSELLPGDFIVMVSDGVAASFDMDESAACNLWLLELLSSLKPGDSPEVIAARIIDGANSSDDKSAAVLYVEAAG